MNDISTSMNTRNISTLLDGCREMGISLSAGQQDWFIRYYEMLLEKNKVMNLTAVTQWEEVQVKHYLDSLLACKVTDLTKNLRVLDLGSGAGFPGIPIKIAYPHLNIVLADSLNKRVTFLQEVIQELGLEGIEAVHGRAEDLARNASYRESFDLVVSRAVANLSSLSEYCLPFVKVGGSFIAYKSAAVREEVLKAEKAIRILSGSAPGITSLLLPTTEMTRSFVIVRKERSTPGTYPRKAGTPSRNPLS